MAAVLLCAGLAGCDADEEIRVFTVPKGSETIAGVTEASEPAGSVRGSPGGYGDEAASSGVREDGPVWALPEGWREVGGERPMRLATFEIEDESGPVEVAVTRFPGDVGGMLANVNRWREQLGLEPVTEAALPELLEGFESPGFAGHLLHLRGPSMDMVAASLYEPAEDRTWFVRVVADAEVADRVAPSVFEFARSFGRGGY